MMQRIRTVVLALAAVAAFTTASAHGQTAAGWDASGLQLTRPQLEALLERLEATATSTTYSGALRAQARAEATLVRQRLEEGDIRVGDRILLSVEGEPQLSDTFTVVDRRVVMLPEVGEVPLTGVLRSELQDHMARHMGLFFRAPVVQARSLIRVQILGAVRNPGFFMVPSDLALADAIMLAGGPAGEGRLDHARIERGRDVIWDGDRLQDAIMSGSTLDQLSVRAGDRILLPAARSRFAAAREVAMFVSGIMSLVFLADRLGAF
jgi:protein involved in polysaccharide export with SLBB domain